MLLWLQLLLCLGIIGYAGHLLSRYGDIIAEKTGISASWIGLILLFTVMKKKPSPNILKYPANAIRT